MAALVQEVMRGRTGEIAADFSHTYARMWQVVFEGPTARFAGPLSAMALVSTMAGVSVGSPYVTSFESDPYSFLRKFSAKDDGESDGLGFFVGLDYGPWEPQSEDPTENPAEVDVDHSRQERIVDEDVVDGGALLNSAEDPFDPPIVADDSRLVLTITRNEYRFNPLLADAVRDTINIADCKIAGTIYRALTLKALAPKASRQFHPRIGFYARVTYQFESNRDTWKGRTLDCGMRKLVAGERKAIFTKEGLPVGSPVLLDGTGLPLDPPDADPVYLVHNKYLPIDFSIFNLENV